MPSSGEAGAWFLTRRGLGFHPAAPGLLEIALDVFFDEVQQAEKLGQGDLAGQAGGQIALGLAADERDPLRGAHRQLFRLPEHLEEHAGHQRRVQGLAPGRVDGHTFFNPEVPAVYGCHGKVAGKGGHVLPAATRPSLPW